MSASWVRRAGRCATVVGLSVAVTFAFALFGKLVAVILTGFVAGVCEAMRQMAYGSGRWG